MLRKPIKMREDLEHRMFFAPKQIGRTGLYLAQDVLDQGVYLVSVKSFTYVGVSTNGQKPMYFGKRFLMGEQDEMQDRF